MTSPDFACDLEALTVVDRNDHATLTRELYEATRHVERQPDAITLALDGGADALTLAARWAALESQCCPFWRFELTFEDAATTLTLRGPDGAAALLDEVAAGFAS
jgi:hypothetical protein